MERGRNAKRRVERANRFHGISGRQPQPTMATSADVELMRVLSPLLKPRSHLRFHATPESSSACSTAVTSLRNLSELRIQLVEGQGNSSIRKATWCNMQARLREAASHCRIPRQ